MALVSMREILEDARQRKYAVGGFNVFNFETLGAVGEVGEELKAPIVLGVAERLFKF
ncbi:MAG: fbaA, partial [Firmicutes bacterium]|nr:fbaA [Bacillota bacterium]